MSEVIDLSEHWRNRASEVMAMTKTSRDPETHADLLEIAESYEHLANLAATADGIPKRAGGNRSFVRPTR